MARSTIIMLVFLALAVLAAPAAVLAEGQVRPAGGPYADLAAQALSAVLGPCLATEPTATVSISITVAPGIRVSLPIPGMWGGVQTMNATLTAIVSTPGRIPQVVSTSTTLTSGWVWTQAGTFSLDASVGPEVVVKLATAAAPRVAAALGCPSAPAQTPGPAQPTPADENERP